MPGYNAYVSSTTYTPFGEPSEYVLGPSTNTAKLTYDYDPQTRRPIQSKLSAQQALPQIDDTKYTYDPAGNITRAVNTQGQPGGTTPYWTSWQFDPNGLRTQQVQHALTTGTPDTATTYTYPAAGAPRPHTLTSTTTNGPTGTSTTSYGYDSVGNTKTRQLPAGAQTLTWDIHNRLSTVATPAGNTSYIYDADGNQLIRRDPGKTTLFLPGQEFTRDDNTGVVTGTRYYDFNGTTIAIRIGDANPKYVATGLHGTASVTADSIGFAVTRRTMDPYGNRTRSCGSSSYCCDVCSSRHLSQRSRTRGTDTQMPSTPTTMSAAP